jgi:putative sterol carrier protein
VAARDFFANLESGVDPAQIDGLDHSYLFDIEGEGRWLVEVHDGKVSVTENPEGGADVSFQMSAETFDRLLAGKQNPMVAYMTGKLKVDGDLSAARELQKLF